MFEASRQFFHRSPATAAPTAAGANGATQAEEARQRGLRHPAMRGLQVSPVHGRHCICPRCERLLDAA